jgi:probable phosphoglycerate mutase
MTEKKSSRSGPFDQAFLTSGGDITKLILVRHGEQDLRDGTVYSVGDTIDPVLSKRGESQVKLVGERLKDHSIDSIYASPLIRAHETGKSIAQHHPHELTLLDDLREVHLFRDAPQDRPLSDVLGEAHLKGLVNRMAREKRWDVYPLSESSFDLRKRVVNVMEEIIAGNPGKTVAVACHGGVINAYLAHILNVDHDMFFRPGHTSLNVVAAHEGVRAVHSLNDVRHLEEAGGELVSY